MFNASVSHFDEGSCFVQTSDGGYLIAGNLEDNVYWAPYGGFADNLSATLIKTDTSGNLQWQKIDSAFYDTLAVFQTEELGYFAVTDTYLLKLDAQGNIQSNKTVGMTISGAVQTASGDYVLAGMNEEIGMLIKVDGNGNLLWNTTLFSVDPHAPTDRHISNVVMTKDGDYLTVSWSSTFTNAVGKDFPNLWVFKTDSNGSLQFTKTYSYNPIAGQSLPPDVGKQDNPAVPNVNYVVATKDGGCLLAGVGFAPFLVKFDSKGNWQWNRLYANDNTISADFSSAVQTASGMYVAVGAFPNSGNVNYPAALIMQTDDQGNLQWNQTFNGWAPNAGASSIVTTEDGGYAVVGGLNGNIWLAKFVAESGVSSLFPTSLDVAVLGVVIVFLSVLVVSLFVFRRHRKTLKKV